MVRLAEAHIEQIKTLRAEGKTAKEIVDVMEQTYPGVKFALHHVYAATKSAKKAVGGGEAKVKRQYKKRAISVETSGDDELNKIIKDILAIPGQLKKGYGLVFNHLRTELIKSRSEVNKMLSGAGLPEIEGDIE